MLGNEPFASCFRSTSLAAAASTCSAPHCWLPSRSPSCHSQVRGYGTSLLHTRSCRYLFPGIQTPLCQKVKECQTLEICSWVHVSALCCAVSCRTSLASVLQELGANWAPAIYIWLSIPSAALSNMGSGSVRLNFNFPKPGSCGCGCWFLGTCCRDSSSGAGSTCPAPPVIASLAASLLFPLHACLLLRMLCVLAHNLPAIWAVLGHWIE